MSREPGAAGGVSHGDVGHAAAVTAPHEDPPGRTVAGVGPLSRLPAERSLQQLVIAMAVVGIGALVSWGVIVLFSGALDDAEEGSSLSDAPAYDGFRLAVTVLAVLLALRLAQLAVRHRDDLRTVTGLRRQYLLLCVLGCVLYTVFLPWPAFLVHAAVAVYLLTLRPAPPEERREHITGGTFG